MVGVFVDGVKLDENVFASLGKYLEPILWMTLICL